MSLLQNEDFLVWQLRTSYLTNIKDGIGERLINVDSSILNDPAFRAAGWTANIPELKRTYSPPIPTAISSDYFAAPPRSAGFAPAGFGDEEEEGGMVTGRGSTDTVGPGPNVRRRRRREQHDEDDSSDLSDDSDDDEGARREAQKIKFAKMPVRTRSGSSPIRSSVAKDGLEVIVTSPSRRSNQGRLRSGSLTSVEAVKQRARRDTTTSSDMSSENEIDTTFAKRGHRNPSKAVKASNLLTAKLGEDEKQIMRKLTTTINEDSGEGSDRSSMSSDFGQTADSESLLDDMVASSLTDMPAPLNISSKESPSKPKNAQPSFLQALPPPRPISTIQPVSLLGQALRAGKTKPRDPLETFAKLSGKGVPDPLNIKIYAPFSEKPNKPFELPLLRNVQDNNSGETPQVTVAEAIGLALWRYREEGLKPPLEDGKLSVNHWVLRMVDDGEVEYDFPALDRVTPIAQFTANNNKGARGRSREKPVDEFALVEASEREHQRNRTVTPIYDRYTTTTEDATPLATTSANRQSQPESKSGVPTTSPPPPQPTKPAPAPPRFIPPKDHSTPRMGPPKMLKIHFTSLEALTQVTTIEVTTDTYLAEVLDQVCKRWKLDKSYHILKLSNSSTVAPVDRVVEVLGTATDLDLVRRRFANDGALGLMGSPSSSSPTAPLLLPAATAGTETSRKGAKRGAPMMHPLQRQRTQDLFGNSAKFKKYNVVRKQPMSFAPSHQRVIMLDEDFMHILPGETGKTLFESSGKSSRVPFSMIVGCKVSRRHPKSFRVIAIRDNQDTKRYDFEAQSVADANEIVEEIQKGMEPYDQQHQGLG